MGGFRCTKATPQAQATADFWERSASPGPFPPTEVNFLLVHEGER